MTPEALPAASITSAAGVAELGAEALGSRLSYGEGALIVCDRVVRIYVGDGIEVQALQGLDLLVQKGELTALVGASGSGKSTQRDAPARGWRTPAARPASTPWSTRSWTGRAGSSCRATWSSGSACGTVSG
jgi:hypothetical protein